MVIIDHATTVANLPFPALIDALDVAFASGDIVAPARSSHLLAKRSAGDDILLTMPSWTVGGYIGVKLVTVMPAASPTVRATFLLMSAATGEALAMIDGDALTGRRTAAASALAARYLARSDAGHLLMIGAGALSADMIRAHAALRPLTSIRLWARDEASAHARAKTLDGLAIDIVPADALEQAVGQADIICCATTARTPVVKGAWLRPGQHLDLVGGFRPDMREVDDDAIMRAYICVDTREGALFEAGDLVQPIAAGCITAAAVRATLRELCGKAALPRMTDGEITLYKSVGTAIADLAGAVLVYEQCTHCDRMA